MVVVVVLRLALYARYCGVVLLYLFCYINKSNVSGQEHTWTTRSVTLTGYVAVHIVVFSNMRRPNGTRSGRSVFRRSSQLAFLEKSCCGLNRYSTSP